MLIARHEGKLRLKLADFGLAKNYSEAGLSDLTADNDARGTLGYKAPEQVMDCRAARPPCDIYSIGVTLYHFLAKRSPFHSASVSEVLRKILDNDYPPLESIRPDLPAELVAVVRTAMQIKPEKRHSSAAAMRRALLPFARAAH
jgi:serine/threonine-protein kinase